MKCENTRENAIKNMASSANVGRWITRDGEKIYVNKAGTEYAGSVGMLQFRKDQGKHVKPTKKRRRRKKRRKRRS